MNSETNPCRSRLVRAIEEAGGRPLELKAAAGSSVVAMGHGARVIGLFVGEDSPNFLWVDPRLYYPRKAKEVIESEEWVNTGGDRTWVGPETDTMIGDLNAPWDTYTFPAGIDPGHYEIERCDHLITMAGSGCIPQFKTEGNCEVKIEKQIRMIISPLHSEAPDIPCGKELSFVGYEQETSLYIRCQEQEAGPLDIWNLLVVPAGGWMIAPTIGRAYIRDIMVPSGQDRLQVSDSHVRFLIDGCSQHKVSARAISLAGRAGYLRCVSESTWTLVVRNFSVNPSGMYVDSPWDRPGEWGYCLQFYNHCEGPDSWGEMEYHTPAIGGESGLRKYLDVSQVWAFMGDEKPIQAVAELLLGPGISDIG